MEPISRSRILQMGLSLLFLSGLAWSIGLCAPLWRAAVSGQLHVDLSVSLQLMPLPLGMASLPLLFRAQQAVGQLEHWNRRQRRRLRWVCRAAFLAVGLSLLYATVAFIPWISMVYEPWAALERVGIPACSLIWIFWLRRQLERAELRNPRFFDEEFMTNHDTRGSVN